MASHHDHEKASATEQMQMLSVHDHDEKADSLDELPSPVSSPVIRPSTTGKTKLSATAIIPVWICLSSAVIIYNNYLYNTLNFRYPVFLVTWHLSFAVSTLGFQPVLLGSCRPRRWRAAGGRPLLPCSEGWAADLRLSVR